MILNSSTKKQKKITRCPNCTNHSFSTKYLYSINSFGLYLCEGCKTGFTYPIPKNLSKYYHTNYWITPGIIGHIKDLLFKFFQKRRIEWVLTYLKPRGKLLDVGAGEGNFIKQLPTSVKAKGVDSPASKIKNPSINKVDFLKWKTKDTFDVIVFWESLEHTSNPQKYLEKAFSLLKNDGLVFIEYPRFDCLESKMYGKYWFHLDVPRHSSHLTEKGLSIILKRAKFTPMNHFSVSAFEYTLWGFTASLLSIFKISLTDKLKQFHNIIVIVSLIPLAAVAFIFEVFFLAINQSPIGLVIAKKK